MCVSGESTGVEKEVSYLPEGGESGVFVVEGGSLEVLSLLFLLSTETSSVVNVPVFNVESGKIDLDEIAMRPEREGERVTLSHPLILLHPDCVSSFRFAASNVCLPQSNGSVICAHLNELSSFSLLAGCNMSGCSALYGGAIYLSISSSSSSDSDSSSMTSSSSSMIPSPSLSLKAVLLSECSALNSGGMGSGVFVGGERGKWTNTTQRRVN